MILRVSCYPRIVESLQEVERKAAEEQRQRELEASRVAEEETKRREQQERDQKKARMQAEYEQSLEVRNRIDPARVVKSQSGSAHSLALDDDDEHRQSTDGTDEFALALVDSEMDSGERDELKRLRNQRIRDEAARKRKLQREHEEHQLRHEHQQMMMLQEIGQQRQREEEQRRKDLEVTQVESVTSIM